MTKKEPVVTTTKHKIGKVTYIIESSASKDATDSLNQKINKSIKRNVENKSQNS